MNWSMNFDCKKKNHSSFRLLLFSMYGRVYSTLSLLAHFSLFRWDSPSLMSEEACKSCLCGSGIKENKWRHQIYIRDGTFVHDHRQCNQGENHEVLSLIITGSLTLGACICCILCALLFLSSIFIFYIVSSCSLVERELFQFFKIISLKLYLWVYTVSFPDSCPAYFHILYKSWGGAWERG